MSTYQYAAWSLPALSLLLPTMSSLLPTLGVFSEFALLVLPPSVPRSVTFGPAPPAPWANTAGRVAITGAVGVLSLQALAATASSHAPSITEWFRADKRVIGRALLETHHVIALLNGRWRGFVHKKKKGASAPLFSDTIPRRWNQLLARFDTSARASIAPRVDSRYASTPILLRRRSR